MHNDGLMRRMIMMYSFDANDDDDENENNLDSDHNDAPGEFLVLFINKFFIE